MRRMAEEASGVRRRGFDRVVNFSDAVVAIAITLLILPLVDSVAGDEQLEVRHVLSDDASRLLGFALSFVVIARFWLAHHRLFEAIEAYNVALLWANLAWLLSIVWLPYPTEIIGGQGTEDAVGRGIYIGSVLVTAATLLLIQVVIARTPALWVDPARSGVDVFDGISTVVALAVALLVAVAVPAIGMWAMLLLLASPYAAEAVRRRRNRAADRAPG
jgi:TMEM175 potassium channel family protein